MFFNQFEKLELGLHGVRMPSIKLDDNVYQTLKIKNDIDNESLLKLLCKIGFEERIKSGQINKEDADKYRERFKVELQTIKDGGFIDYFILMWDIVRFVREKNIPKGAARGSAAGCLIFYLLYVTDIDPLKYGLYFERFLSKARLKKIVVDGITYLDGSLVPDCDCDIGNLGRESVVNYMINKYKGKSCKLSTSSTLSSKILIKECGKIVGEYSEQTMNDVSSYIESLFGKVKTLEESYNENEHFRKFCDENPEVHSIAQKLHGLIKSKGSHASGYLISYDNLDQCIPVELGTDGEIVSGYDMYDAGDIAIKVDLLGLQDVTLLFRVCESVGIDPNSIDVNDPFIYDCIKNLTTPFGLFQIGADCNFRVTQKVRPRNIDELSAVISLARPGALAFVEDFATFTNTGQIADFDIESEKLKAILKETGGIILYQETLMRVANEVFELSLDESELIRRAVGKKDKEKMKSYESLILKQGDLLNIPKSAKFYWDVLIASSNYSFNKCIFEDEIVNKEGKQVQLKDINIGDKILTFDTSAKKNKFATVKDKMFNQQDIYEVKFNSGKKIRVSADHKFICSDGQKRTCFESMNDNVNIIVL